MNAFWSYDAMLRTFQMPLVYDCTVGNPDFKFENNYDNSFGVRIFRVNTVFYFSIYIQTVDKFSN